MSRPLGDDNDGDDRDECDCTFDAGDFVAIYDRLLDRLAGMQLPDGMGLRQAIAEGYVSPGAIEAAIADAWRGERRGAAMTFRRQSPHARTTRLLDVRQRRREGQQERERERHLLVCHRCGSALGFARGEQQLWCGECRRWSDPMTDSADARWRSL